MHLRWPRCWLSVEEGFARGRGDEFLLGFRICRLKHLFPRLKDCKSSSSPSFCLLVYYSHQWKLGYKFCHESLGPQTCHTLFCLSLVSLKIQPFESRDLFRSVFSIILSHLFSWTDHFFQNLANVCSWSVYLRQPEKCQNNFNAKQIGIKFFFISIIS